MMQCRERGTREDRGGSEKRFQKSRRVTRPEENQIMNGDNSKRLAAKFALKIIKLAEAPAAESK